MQILPALANTFNAMANTPVKKYSCAAVLALSALGCLVKALSSFARYHQLEGKMNTKIEVTAWANFAENIRQNIMTKGQLVGISTSERTICQREQAAARNRALLYTIGTLCLSALCVGALRK